MEKNGKKSRFFTQTGSLAGIRRGNRTWPIDLHLL